MLIFGLHSTSKDWLSNVSDESWPKCKERPPKSSKNEILIFGLRSTSADQLSNPSDKSQPKCKNRHPKSSKMKCSFLDYIQLLMIGQVIQVMKVDQNVKKGPLSHKKCNAHFWIMFNFWWSAEQSEQWKFTKMHHQVPQNDLEWPISPDSQRFQSFPSKVAQDNSEQPVSPNLQLFESIPTKVAQNG